MICSVRMFLERDHWDSSSLVKHVAERKALGSRRRVVIVGDGLKVLDLPANIRWRTQLESRQS